MRKMLFIIYFVVLMFGCGSTNTKKSDSLKKEISENYEPTFNEIEWDSTIMENDSTIYDSQLQLSPFTKWAFECFKNNSDSIINHEIQVYDRTYNLKKVYYHDSYMLFAESDEYGNSLLQAVIFDTLIPLKNHIRVGSERKQLETYYQRNIKCDTIRIIDESEFTEIKIYMKHDVIYKIIFICYECENELGLL